MKAQVDIPTELNKKLKVFRIEKGFKNRAEAIIHILEKTLNRKK